MTEKQIQANRKNAKLGGVKTEKGRAVSRLNAVQYGILAKEAVITKGDGKENEKEFLELQRRFFEELKPVGMMETILVDRILCNYWRLRRVIWAEVGETRKLQDAFLLRTATKLVEDAIKKDKLAFIYSYQERISSSVGAENMLEFLNSVEEELDNEGSLSEETTEKLFRNFGSEEGSLALWITAFNPRKMDGDADVDTNTENAKSDGGKDVLLPEEAKRCIKIILEKEREKLTSAQELFGEKEHLENESALYATSLPDKEAIEKITRYEAMLERSLLRSLHELQRLQALRLGEKPPAPVAIDIDVSKD